MAAGLQVFDESGRIVTDVTTRLCRIAGVIHIGAELSGSFQSYAITQGTPFAIFYMRGKYPGFVRYSFSGQTFNWWKTNAESSLKPALSTITGYFIIGCY